MSALLGVTVAGPVFATPTSADVVTVAFDVALLSDGAVSEVPLVAEAVFETVEPGARLEFARRVSPNVAVVPLRSTGAVQETVPVAPTAGVVQLNVGPAVCMIETNVAEAERLSVSAMFAASFGPRFWTLIV